MSRFGEMYKNAISEYKTNYFKERSAFSLFTRYMIGRGTYRQLGNCSGSMPGVVQEQT